MLFAARFVGGLMAGNIAAAFAYVSDITTPENRSKGMGVIGAAFGLGFIFGPVIGGDVSPAPIWPMPILRRRPSSQRGYRSSRCYRSLLRLARKPVSLNHARHSKAQSAPRDASLAIKARRLEFSDLRRLIAMSFLIVTAMAILETSFTIWVNGNQRLGTAPGWLYLRLYRLVCWRRCRAASSAR